MMFKPLNMVSLAHKLVGITKLCEMCGTEITDENQSDRYEYGCTDCDHETHEPKPFKHGRSIDDPTIDHYEERLIEERRAG